MTGPIAKPAANAAVSAPSLFSFSFRSASAVSVSLFASAGILSALSLMSFSAE